MEFYLESEVEKIEKKGDGFTLHVNKKSLHVNKVLIATGGLAMPSLGSCESGYEFAKSFGHTIVPTHASLVQLETQENLKNIAGVKFEGNIEVYVDDELKNQTSGDILFTNYGISGSAVLDMSRVCASALEHKRSVSVKLDLLPEYTKEQLKNLLKNRLKFSYGKSIALWLEGFINSKIARYIENKLQIKEADKLNNKELGKLVYELKNISLHVNGTKGYKTAEVTAGGVDVNEVNPNTFESKLQKGLYFSGEVLDIDADCGGYNLHWAWASGYCVGQEIVK